MTQTELTQHLLAICAGAQKHALIWDNLGLTDRALVLGLERCLQQQQQPVRLFLLELLHEAGLSNTP